MSKISKSAILLSLVVVFSFIYRFSLMMADGYPPGADIGLHNSLIHSITLSGNTNFLYNFYHMGEGVSLTFPGYHIFVSYVILLTEMPDYLAHALVSSLFSTLTVLVAFLLTKKLWSLPAGLIVAFFVAISRLDIEMLMWGGYPNVIALLLIPLIFYLFMRKPGLRFGGFLVVTSILSGALFLTHNLSALVFLAITASIVIIGLIFAKRFSVSRKKILSWVLPLFLGLILVSPFLIDAIPLFLGGSKDIFIGTSQNALAVQGTQNLSLEFFLPLLVYVLLFFLLSRIYEKKFLTIPTLLLSMWLLVPGLGSQGYLVGLISDYKRLAYFVNLPILMLIGVVFVFISDKLSKIIHKVLFKLTEISKKRRSANRAIIKFYSFLTPKTGYSILLILLLVLSIFYLPVLTNSKEENAHMIGTDIQSYYQVIDDSLYDAIIWTRNSTPKDSILVADEHFGWWLAGFAQRQTYSASEPQYLILAREFEPAKNAKALLDTDFVIDNGLIQIREDGGYIARHNPTFLLKRNDTYFPYDLYNFNSKEIVIDCRISGEPQEYSLSDLSVDKMSIDANSSQAILTVDRSNQFFSSKQTITVYKGMKYANYSLTFETSRSDVFFDEVEFLVFTKFVHLYELENSLALIEPNNKVGGQMMFTKNVPEIKSGNPYSRVKGDFYMEYRLEGQSFIEIEIFAGMFQIPYSFVYNEEESAYLSQFILNNTQTYLDSFSEGAIDIFDYTKFLEDWNVSYVFCRDSGIMDKFVKDAVFRRVYSNAEVSIFKVNLNKIK